MTNLTLYTIADEYLNDVKKLESMELDEATFKDTLEGLSGELEVKATNVAMFIGNLEATADAIKQAEKQMADRRKKIEAKAEALRSYLLENMLRTGISKIDSPYFSLATKKNPPSVEVLNMSAIPTEYFDIPEPPPPQLNKTRLKDDLKEGVIIEGARLNQSMRLEIK